jgi:hypothetical protein
MSSARGRRKAAVLDHAGKEVQIVQILHGLPHRSISRTLNSDFAV